ncbi:MAG: UDP-N-acetylmuramate--L-alanine ligase [Bacteroidales bacterium]|nr:UDP-N-acetylmuramate--L-alanine ligase [Bacteroidales bacterium]
MDYTRYSHIFMIGIGGIGMSALARYFHHSGIPVSGYDRTRTHLTSELEQEGIPVIYSDTPGAIDPIFKNPDTALIIFTPAIKADNQILRYFTEKGFKISKRAEILGEIASRYKTIAVSGTHGKTSTSTAIAHLLNQSVVGCTALLGGISKNYKTNFLFSRTSELMVTEADEFDRSFLNLKPYMAVITAVDADHLDIYGTANELVRAYDDFAGQIDPEGILLVKIGLPLNLSKIPVERIYSYSFDDLNADIYARHIEVDEHKMQFDLVTPDGTIDELTMKPTGIVNIENAVAASFLALQAGLSEAEIRSGLTTFEGVRRRFDLQFNNGMIVYIDDYAHHPEEINALIRSVKSVFPFKKITGIFQPHLYSRTRDFADGFADSLSQLDEVILTDIYPAREKPIEGVSSTMIFNKIGHHHKSLMQKEQVPYYLLHHDFEVVLTIGAGDIDTLVEPMLEMINRKTSKQELP